MPRHGRTERARVATRPDQRGRRAADPAGCDPEVAGPYPKDDRYPIDRARGVCRCEVHGGAHPGSGGVRGRDVTGVSGKQAVTRLVDEVVNQGWLEVLHELYAPEMVGVARRWIEQFLSSFPDAHMEPVCLLAEGDVVAGQFRCTGTHLGVWLGHPPTGRRFSVSEVYFFTFTGGLISSAWGLEDNHRRLRQLGLGA